VERERVRPPRNHTHVVCVKHRHQKTTVRGRRKRPKTTAGVRSNLCVKCMSGLAGRHHLLWSVKCFACEKGVPYFDALFGLLCRLAFLSLSFCVCLCVCVFVCVGVLRMSPILNSLATSRSQRPGLLLRSVWCFLTKPP
jgi:hypothetical protein